VSRAWCRWGTSGPLPHPTRPRTIGPIVDGILPQVMFLVAAGFVGGLVLFARGLVAYRRDRLVEAVATSRLDALAAGEVRISGTVEAVAMTLVSPLQSRPCVWYRARVEETGENSRLLMNEERAQEFDLRDETGRIRVVPRGARWEISHAFDESTGLTGDEPPGLEPRTGSSFAAIAERDPERMSELERDAAVEALLTVKVPTRTGAADAAVGGSSDGVGIGLGVGKRGKRYREARLEPGETVTIIGQALPWSDVRETFRTWDAGSNVERDIAGDIAEARAAGLLANSSVEAWGNAAIPGFGIGRPTEMPDLDPEAAAPEVIEPGAEPTAADRYLVGDDELVVARGHSILAIYAGTPALASSHHDSTFVLGIVGAVMSVISVVALGVMLTGRILS
jgi:hypothetical protein